MTTGPQTPLTTTQHIAVQLYTNNDQGQLGLPAVHFPAKLQLTLHLHRERGREGEREGGGGGGGGGEGEGERGERGRGMEGEREERGINGEGGVKATDDIMGWQQALTTTQHIAVQL